MARKRRTKAKAGEFEPRRWAHATFMVATFLLIWFFYHLIDDGWEFVWSQWPQVVPRPTAILSQGISIGLGLLCGIILWRIERYFRFVCEVAIEVSQVVWPTRTETRAATVVVIVMTAICSLILWGMDSVWSGVTDTLYQL